MWAVLKEGKRRPPRGARCLSMNGEKPLPLHEWAKRLEIPYETLRTRLHAMIDDRAARGLSPYDLTADEMAHVLRPRRMRRSEVLEQFGCLPPTRHTRPTSCDPATQPYYNLTDAQFIALRRFARANDVHMFYMREVMRNANMRDEVMQQAMEYLPTKDEMKTPGFWITL